MTVHILAYIEDTWDALYIVQLSPPIDVPSKLASKKTTTIIIFPTISAMWYHPET